jgi:GTPase SAR1 family protein
MKNLHIDGETIRLQLWDTAGQERFRVLIPSYIKDSSVAIIVFDITSNSFVSKTPPILPMPKLGYPTVRNLIFFCGGNLVMP